MSRYSTSKLSAIHNDYNIVTIECSNYLLYTAFYVTFTHKVWQFYLIFACISNIFILAILFYHFSSVHAGILAENPHLVLLYYLSQLFLRELFKSYRLIQVVPMDMSGYYGEYHLALNYFMSLRDNVSLLRRKNIQYFYVQPFFRFEISFVGKPTMVCRECWWFSNYPATMSLTMVRSSNFIASVLVFKCDSTSIE